MAATNDPLERKAAGDESWPPDAWRGLFWDVDPRSLDRTAHQRFIIERVLELGDLAAVRALYATYGRADIAHVVLTSRQLSTRSANFWALILDLRERPRACTTLSWTEQPLIS